MNTINISEFITFIKDSSSFTSEEEEVILKAISMFAYKEKEKSNDLLKTFKVTYQDKEGISKSQIIECYSLMSARIKFNLMNSGKGYKINSIFSMKKH